jgi:hypothetical protein
MRCPLCLSLSLSFIPSFIFFSLFSFLDSSCNLQTILTHGFLNLDNFPPLSRAYPLNLSVPTDWRELHGEPAEEREKKKGRNVVDVSP